MLADLNYRNLDDGAVARRAEHLHRGARQDRRRPAGRPRVQAGHLGPGAQRPVRHRGHPARVPRRLGQLRACAVTGSTSSCPSGDRRPERPSGGNVYDRRLVDGARAAGWDVHEHRVAGRRRARPGARRAPGRADVLVDGLIGVDGAGDGGRGRRGCGSCVLLHMPRGRAGSVLRAADAVVTTSRWARQWVIEHHGLAPDRVHVARARRGSAAARGRVRRRLANLLCVGPVTPDKGHDVLLDALAELADLEWRCTCVGALDLDPDVRRSRCQTQRDRRPGDASPGRSPGRQLEAVRSTTDLVVSASRRESFGMAVAEGLARGIPVVATEVGGHPEAVGRDRRGAAGPARRRARPRRCAAPVADRAGAPRAPARCGRRRGA